MSEMIQVVYAIKCPAQEDIRTICRAIAREQTVEVPKEVDLDPFIEENIVGKLLEITPLTQKNGSYTAVIGYAQEITAYQIPQLLNVLFGNISLKNYIKIIDVRFPETFLAKFHGPNFGIKGIRKLLGVQGRPLAATALKPLGSTPKQLAAMAGAFALGGGDIVKDDHGLADHDFCPFEERVERCQTAIAEANVRTGKMTLYFPNVSGDLEHMEQQVAFAIRQGVRGLLLSPFLIGPDNFRYLAKKYPLIMMAHPAFTGTHFHDPHHGMTPAVLLGTLFRLFGADISVFPNSGGRFGFTSQECQAISGALKRPLGAMPAALPAPAGGMTLASINTMKAQYGQDAVYLIGGALLKHSDDLESSTRYFLETIHREFDAHETGPDAGVASAGERSKADTQSKVLEYLKWQSGFTWQGRETEDYKTDSTTSFANIVRQELIGKNGEQTKFDLRYFQIEPGGYSSLEKHMHEHVIVAVQGEGVLQLPGQTLVLGPFDVAYVPPFAVHQLRNESKSAFGFFCIVDHERDKPVKP
ncbi:cupin domain-containing protein [bacterium]|nr:cupin domain-containing protein [bacterium]